MDIKNFHYISKTKVEMFLSQIKQNSFSFSNLKPKIEIAGFGLGIEYASQAESQQNVVKNTLSLLKSLKQKKLIQSLSELKFTKKNTFVLDNSKWFHGLFSIRYPSKGYFPKSPIDKERDEIIMIYALCKIQERKIFLNFGSPNNILGSKEVGNAMALSGFHTTNATYHHILNIFQDVNETPWETKPSLEGENTKPPLEISIDMKLTEIEKWGDVLSFETHRRRPRPEGYLVHLCLEHLIFLPERNLETMFMIYDEFDNPMEGWETLYLGSPIYTALT